MPRTMAVLPCSQVCTVSFGANESGRKTERYPSAIQRSGNIDAVSWSHSGAVVNTKYTPEMNCSTSATGVTTAGAALALRATDENAMPNTELAATPSTVTQSQVSHLPPSVGIFT